MDDLLEFVLEIVFEGALEATGSPKVPLALRIALGAILVIFMAGISALVLWAGACSENVALVFLGILLFAGFTFITVKKVRKFRSR